MMATMRLSSSKRSRRRLLLALFLCLTAQQCSLIESFTSSPSFGGNQRIRRRHGDESSTAVLHVSNNRNAEDDDEDDEIMPTDRNGFMNGRNISSNPFDITNRPSKSDLYNDDELLNLLNVHEQLTGASNAESGSSQPVLGSEKEPPRIEDKSPMASLHESIMKSYGEDTMERLLDLHDSLEEVRQKENQMPDLNLHKQILEAVGDIQTTSTVPPPANYDWLDTETKDTILNRISAIASDVDGTLLTSKQTIHPRTKQALVRAIQQTQSSKDNKKISYFFPATGKSRKGAFRSLGVEIAALLDKTPGVFLQGLYCLDSKGEIVFEKKLESSALDAAVALAQKHGISIVSYDGDDLYTTEMTDVVLDLTERYGEPRPTCLNQLSDHSPGMHKLLYLDEDVENLNTNIRPLLEKVAAEHGATVTQAMPTMLELLPLGCSKAFGVKKVCEALGIDPSTQLVAIGDAENDVEMLEMAAIGVAVGNASPLAKEASDFFLEETNDEGGAGVAMEVFGFGDGLQL